jgi:hypothetical protein
MTLECRIRHVHTGGRSVVGAGVSLLLLVLCDGYTRVYP